MTEPTAPTEKKLNLLQEFREFLTTGDLMTIAVAFIMAVIIKDLIQSFIENIFTGILGLFLGDKCVTDPETKKTVCKAFGDLQWRTINYGAFLNQVLTFVTTAFVVFVLVKAYKKLTKRSLGMDGPSTNDLLTEIRDELRASR
ncbi:MAG: MscL family protein [Ilumatobacteraceae bacterium]